MTEQQANLFKLFKEIDAVCKKNNIDYYLVSCDMVNNRLIEILQQCESTLLFLTKYAEIF